MAAASFIAGDWGTTNLRLVLCDRDGAELETIAGPGVSQIDGRFDTVFSNLTAPWTRQLGPVPAVLCGMVGSTLGWVNVPYVPCPTAPRNIALAMASIREHQVFIAPGLSCRNRHGAPDVMRGEETQILGAMRLDPSLQSGRHLLCLPGTHTKWAMLDDGVVREFLTSVSGELFAIVSEHSVLIRAEGAASDSRTTFQRAVDHVRERPEAALSHLLFECRSRQVTGELEKSAAKDFLSGLLIAHDMCGARRVFADTLQAGAPVILIGTPQLMDLHDRAAVSFGMATRQIDGSRASLAGLALLHAQRSGTEDMHAA